MIVVEALKHVSLLRIGNFESYLPVLRILPNLWFQLQVLEATRITYFKRKPAHFTMGNLLGSPVVEKETHVGHTDEFDYGLSSMQGWRVHMEDAHIAEAHLYALEKKDDDTVNKIELPGHAFFGVFDGHGGTFAAQYTGDNLCRVLSQQPSFVQYAKLYRESLTKTFETPQDKVQFLRKGIEHLETALQQAFVTIDWEIALATRGTPHPQANEPYQPAGTDSSASAEHAEHHVVHPTTPNNAAPSDEDETMEEPSSAMQAAQQAAANHTRALEDDGDSGTTACSVLVTPDWLVCANAGDSRSVFSRNGKEIPLSYDHKPDDEGEERRIRAAGGYVAGGRVEGDLAVSRGLGDFRFKHLPTVLKNLSIDGDETMDDVMKPGDQKVSPIPDILLQTRNREQDEFVIVACDGIWDVRSNAECVEEVATMFDEGESNVGLVCEELLDTCLRLGSKDNMTALVIKFPAQKIGEGGGVEARRKEREEQEHQQQEHDSQTEEEGAEGEKGDEIKGEPIE